MDEEEKVLLKKLDDLYLVWVQMGIDKNTILRAMRATAEKWEKVNRDQAMKDGPNRKE